MLRINVFYIFTFFALANLGVTQALAELPSSQLAQIKQSQQWLNSLDDKSAASIKEELGEPTEKDKWEFQGKSHPVWKYSSESPDYNLHLYFQDDSVINVSLQVQSD